jgi:activating signal cointegrator complex subunit 1
MGKKRIPKSSYNDFLDGEKLTDNKEVRTSLQGYAAGDVLPPRQSSYRPGGSKTKGAAKKPQLTHFLCLPLVRESSRPYLRTSLSTFKSDLSTHTAVPPKAVRPVGTLHLTLGVMSLDAKKLDSVTSFLADLNLHSLLRDTTHRLFAEKAAEQGTVCENLNADALPHIEDLSVDLRGLVAMQSPSKTSVLYAEPRDTSERLLPFAQALKDQFVKAGFLVQDERELKLHATVLNTIYAKPKRGGKVRSGKQGREDVESISQQQEDGREDDEKDWVGNTPTLPTPSTATVEDGKGWQRFDARVLIDKYQDFVWAEDVRIDRLCICEMGAKKILGSEGEVVDEAYEVVGSKDIFS